MKTEKMVMLTGAQYQEIREKLESQTSITYDVGTKDHPDEVSITDIYLDTDPEFTRNPKQYAQIHNDKLVQVRIEFES